MRKLIIAISALLLLSAPLSITPVIGGYGLTAYCGN